MTATLSLAKKEAYQDLLDTIKENFRDMRYKIKSHEKPFDFDLQDENGKTVLHTVVEMRNYTEQMWVLLDFFANPDIRDNEGKTALHYAVAVERKDMIICLLLFGANPEIEDNEGRKPFDDSKDDLGPIIEKVNSIKKEFISLGRKRRKFLKHIFDETDKELNSKLMNEMTLSAFYESINQESTNDALKDAQEFISLAKLIKNPYEETSNITFEEFIVAICKIVQNHGMKIIDELIERFKKIRTKVPRSKMMDTKDGGEKKDDK